MPNFKLDPRLCLALASTAGWTNFPISYRREETLFPAFLRQSAMSPQVVLKTPAIKTIIIKNKIQAVKPGGERWILVSCHSSSVLFRHYRVFSLTWPAYMQIYWEKRKRLNKKRIQLPEDWFGTPTWPPFHCFGTPIWPSVTSCENTQSIV